MPACTWCDITDCTEYKARDSYTTDNLVIVVNYHRERSSAEESRKNTLPRLFEYPLC